MPDTLELSAEQKAEARGHSREDAALVVANDKPPEAVAPETNTEQTGTDAVPSQDGGGTEAARSATPQAEPQTEPTSWVTDEQRELAASYGLSDDDLKDFSTVDEFRRATRIIDRQLAATVEAQRQAAQQHYAQQQAQQAEEAARAAQANKTTPKFTKRDLEKLKAEGYDEESLAHFKSQNDLIDAFEASELEKSELRETTKRLEQQFQSFNQMVAQSDAQRRANQFHEAVDSLADERFGKTVGADGKFTQLSREADENRKKLYESAEVLAQGMIAQQRAAGRQPQLPPLPVLLQRAKAMTFAGDIAAEAKRKVQDDLTKQSKRVRPVATIRAENGRYASDSKVPMSINEKVQDTLANPALAAALARFREARAAAV